MVSSFLSDIMCWIFKNCCCFFFLICWIIISKPFVTPRCESLCPFYLFQLDCLNYSNKFDKLLLLSSAHADWCSRFHFFPLWKWNVLLCRIRQSPRSIGIILSSKFLLLFSVSLFCVYGWYFRLTTKNLHRSSIESIDGSMHVCIPLLNASTKYLFYIIHNT